MKSNIIFPAFIITSIALTASITAAVFNTNFAKVTIDAWSFCAALFLIIEALYGMAGERGPFRPAQLSRLVRIVIGVCIFTIHTCQIIYGI